MKEYNGKLINNFDEYRQLLAKRYDSGWKTSTEKQIHPVFGKPKSYPFVMIEVDGDSEETYERTELCKVYF